MERPTAITRVRQPGSRSRDQGQRRGARHPKRTQHVLPVSDVQKEDRSSHYLRKDKDVAQGQNDRIKETDPYRLGDTETFQGGLGSHPGNGTNERMVKRSLTLPANSRTRLCFVGGFHVRISRINALGGCSAGRWSIRPATCTQETRLKEREIRLLRASAAGQHPVRWRRQFQLFPVIGKAKSCARQFHPRYGL